MPLPPSAAGTTPEAPPDQVVPAGDARAPAAGAHTPQDPTRAFREAPTPRASAPDQPTQPDPAEAARKARAAARLPQIPGYDVEEFVGKGGMGVVYRARHLATGRTVALKLIGPRAADDEVARERFACEVHALAQIKHPNVVPVYDADEWAGFPYCTMEFVAGGTLNEHLERFTADPNAAAGLMVKVARGVEALHAAGIIHRDLKPLNILLGPGDEPLVADFGLAKWLSDESDLTLTGLPVGTRQYMSPEQTLGRRQSYTAACDVWALGVTLYELLTGHRPFPDDGLSGVYHAIRTAEPVPLAALSPDVPAPLQAVVMKCLTKEPGNRYPTAAALADELDRWLRREPVLTPPIAEKPAEQPAVEAPELGPAPAEVNVPPPPARRRARRAAVGFAVALAVAGLTAPGLIPKKSIAERIAAGETVALTDDKGNPLVEVIDEPGHGLQRDTVDDHRCFLRVGYGAASLLDQPLPDAYRVEAELGTTEHYARSARAGIYVGRKVWGGLPFKHESLFAASIGPIPVGNKMDLVSVFERYWWMRHENGALNNFGRKTSPWHPENKKTKLRFAPVRIDVRGDSIEATIDGHKFGPFSSDTITHDLNTTIVGYQMDSGFPEYECKPPCLGHGIGIFCFNGTCVVRNLTVTKLAPNP